MTPRDFRQDGSHEARKGRLEEHADQLVRKAISMALSDRGNAAILIGLLHKLIPNQRDKAGSAMPFHLEQPTSAAHAQELTGRVSTALAAGELDPDTAKTRITSLTAWITAEETVALADCLADLESRISGSSNLRVVK